MHLETRLGRLDIVLDISDSGLGLHLTNEMGWNVVVDNMAVWRHGVDENEDDHDEADNGCF